MKMSGGIVIVFFGLLLAGCGGDLSTPPLAPSAVLQPSPSPAPQPTLTEWAVFTDPSTTFSTSVVHDAQGEVIRVNIANELVWADGTRFPEFIAVGNFIAYHHTADKFFQIRFGTQDGERRAYVTWPDDRVRGAAATVLDLWIDGRGDLKVTETEIRLPGS